MSLKRFALRPSPPYLRNSHLFTLSCSRRKPVFPMADRVSTAGANPLHFLLFSASDPGEEKALSAGPPSLTLLPRLLLSFPLCYVQCPRRWVGDAGLASALSANSTVRLALDLDAYPC